jgi:hypothetical protein
MPADPGKSASRPAQALRRGSVSLTFARADFVAFGKSRQFSRAMRATIY